MTVILVLALFALMLTIEYFYEKRFRKTEVSVAVPAIAQSRVSPSVVAGFNVMDHLRYHPGHTWALQESPELVRVGMDDFAARFAGHVQKINLPQTGTWVRQGQKAVSAERNGKKIELVSPIEGIVVERNETLDATPDLAFQDPYGEGWLFKVNAPDAKTSFRNLLRGSIVRRWMEEAAGHLRSLGTENRVPLMAQDGGLAVDDLGAQLSDEAWVEAGRDFFLN
jgi:glycine cleavage system H protein